MNINKYIKEIETLPVGLCDDIISMFKNDTAWKKADVLGGDKIEDHSIIRNCEKNNFSHHRNIDDVIFQFISIAIKKYAEELPALTLNKDTGYEILKYEVGGFYVQHIDQAPNIPRIVSCSILLNDNFEGGEFLFDGEYKVKQTKGAGLFFPSSYAFPHEILPITKGIRYSIVTWFV